MKTLSRNQQRLHRHARVRSKIAGTSERPRVVIYKSLKHLYAQIINDANSITILSLDDRKMNSEGKTVDTAKQLGLKLAELAQQKGVSQVVFDRAGYKYTGRVKAVADGMREGGINF